MATIAQVAAGLASVLDDVPGLRVVTFVADDVNPPVAILHLLEVEPETMGRGISTLTWEATVLVSRAVDRVGQEALYDYASLAGTNSVWAAVGHNNTLGLPDGTQATVMRYRGLGLEELAAYGYYGGVFEIAVTTPAGVAATTTSASAGVATATGAAPNATAP